MKKIFNLLFSTRLTAVLIVVFSIGMGAATFIENDFGTPAARKLVFDATWFEAVIVLLAVNFIGNIGKYRMWRKESWPTLLFHLSLIVIIIGASISRLIAYEGIMHIREGKESNVIVSDKTYLQMELDNGNYYETEMLLTPITRNDFSLGLETDKGELEVNYIQFIPHAKEVYVPMENGSPIVHLVTTNGMSGRTNIYLRKGEVRDVFGTSFSVDRPGEGDIQILSGENNSLFILPNKDLSLMRMADQSRDTAAADSLNTFEQRALYMGENMSFVFQEFIPNGGQQLISSDAEEDKNNNDALVVEVKLGDERQEVVLFGKKGSTNMPQTVTLNGMNIYLRYGSKLIETPFSIQLNNFELERYPGSNSPASYASEVVVKDQENNKNFPFRIYMNHVLDYRGYRFFQASYDNDEMGTVLSVNHDFLGTMVTYLGYALMTLGMILSLFWNGSRFNRIVGILKSKSVLTLAFVCSGIFASQAANIDSLLATQKISVEHAEAFSRLLVQDEGGRVKPMSTVASEVLRKLQGKNTFFDFSADQVLLGLHADPAVWSHLPIIKIAKGSHTIEHVIGLSGKNARYMDFFDQNGDFILKDLSNEVSKKRKSDLSEEDQLILDISQRVTLLYEIFNGVYMRAFPLPDDPNNTWYSYTDYEAGFTNEDSVFVYHFMPYYFNEVRKSMETGDWSTPDETLGYIVKFQKHYGSNIFPDELKITMEIAYNKLEIFNKLYQYYGLAGFLMLIFLISYLLNERKWIKKIIPVFIGLIVLMFAMHTLGLAARWYISGHAPWSNAYESMVYVAWSAVLFGIIFTKRSKITLAATAIMASTFLMVAHWNWMNPEIGNLVPVLNSYWLMIHVAIIVASYGPFTINFLLGIIGLVLSIFKTTRTEKKIEEQVQRLTMINELIMTIGVFLLAIGTFLGGVWANESWGRYWSWDPKETWALISVMVYSFVLHMRLIPGLRGKIAFNIASVFSYASIMMTYFGVNFYLAGMHSYAKGDPVPVPSFIYYTLIILVTLSIVAYFRNRKFE